MWLSASLYSKCTVFIVNLCYLQVLVKYKKVLSETKIKLFFFTGGFPLTYIIWF